ncbi:MAG: LPXTG cell wall anchor domain-containing protein [Actinomycetes bacterium]
MNARRTASGLVALGAVAVATTLGTATPAHAQVVGSGLFGKQDPTYDGVYRQSLSILALETAGRSVDSVALGWLAKQQCSDGTFTSYRGKTTTACAANGKDSNATGLAVMAQHAAGLSTANAIAGLKTFQDSDGGFFSNKLFSSSPGSDANSTGIALSALAAVGIDPTTVTTGGKSGIDFLQSVQLTCSAAVNDRAAYDYQAESPLVANNFASAQATLGALNAGLPVAHHSGNATQPTMACPGGPADATEAAQDAAGYLARTLQANSGLIPAAFGGGNDYTSTANAIVSLVAAGVGSAQVTQALDALAAHVNSYVKDSHGVDQPAALAWLILAAHAGGRGPQNFGGVNLVTRLQTTEDILSVLPTPPPKKASPTPSASPSPAVASNNSTLPATGGHDPLPVAVVGAVVLLTGGALLFAGQRR